MDSVSDIYKYNYQCSVTAIPTGQGDHRPSGRKAKSYKFSIQLVQYLFKGKIFAKIVIMTQNTFLNIQIAHKL